MRSSPSVISYHPEPRGTAPRQANGVARRFIAAVRDANAREAAFSVFDQAIVSGTSFFTAVIIARLCSREELGIYYLAWTMIVFLTAAQNNLVSIPYTMYWKRRDEDSRRLYAGSTLAHQMMLSALIMAGLLAMAGAISWGVGPVALGPVVWVLLGVAPWLLMREYIRRLAFAHLTLVTAIAVDVTVAVLQVGTLVLLGYLQLLSAATVYCVLGGACAIACGGWFLLKRRPFRFERSSIARDWRNNWSFGKWAFASQLSALAFYALPWILAIIHGEAATGVLAACMTLVGLAVLFVNGVNNFLIPKAAHALAGGGVPSLCRVLRGAVLVFIAALGTFFLVTLLAGDRLAVLIYGGKYAGAGSVIAVLALSTLIEALGIAAADGLWAMERPSVNFVAEAAYSVVILLVACWFIPPLGVMGAAIALLVGRCAGTMIRWSALWRIMELASCEPAPA